VQDKAARLEEEASQLRAKISQLQDKQDGTKTGKSMVGSFIGIATNYMQSLQDKSSSCTPMLAPATVTKTPISTTTQQTETPPPSTNLASSCNTKQPHATTTKKVLGDSNTYQQAHPTTTNSMMCNSNTYQQQAYPTTTKKALTPSTTTNQQQAETTAATTSNPGEDVDAAVRAACKGRSHAFETGLVEALRAGAQHQLAQACTTYKANDPTSKLALDAEIKTRACSWLVEKALPSSSNA
jgi:hypothetical protein